MLSLPTGFGPLDAVFTWDRDETTGDLVMNLTTNNGEHACGTTLNRTAIVDLIGELAKALR